jgi:hypothetical protein
MTEAGIHRLVAFKAVRIFVSSRHQVSVFHSMTTVTPIGQIAMVPVAVGAILPLMGAHMKFGRLIYVTVLA